MRDKNKTFIKKMLMIALVFTMCIASQLKETSAATMKLNKTSVTICRYHQYRLKVTGTKKKVNWKSSNKVVATVDSKGLVTAKESGTARIVATVAGKKLTCKVTVKQYSHQEELAAYAYLAAQTVFYNDADLKIEDARSSTYMDGREFSYFKCTYKDNNGAARTAYVSAYQNDSPSSLEVNVNTKLYGNLVVEISGSKMEQMMLDRSSALKSSTVVNIAKTFEKTEAVTPVKGDNFKTKHSWMDL